MISIITVNKKRLVHVYCKLVTCFDFVMNVCHGNIQIYISIFVKDSC